MNNKEKIQALAIRHYNDADTGITAMNYNNNSLDSNHSSITSELREARLKSGYNLEQISQSLRISQSYLQAIEEKDLKALPERVYVLGFVRSYARYLGFNIDETVQRFKLEVLSDEVNTPYSMPKPIDSGALPKRSLIWVTTMLVIIGMIGGWLYFNINVTPLIEKTRIPEIIQKEIMQKLFASPPAPQADSLPSN